LAKSLPTILPYRCGRHGGREPKIAGLGHCRGAGNAADHAALLLSGRPLGFVAILGILALLGMITENAVILIGQIDAERAQGKGVWEAAIDASSSRFRPIMLTAVSTVLGMIPIAPTVFWGPMAFAIMGGLLVATILTLIFLPTLYVARFRG